MGSLHLRMSIKQYSVTVLHNVVIFFHPFTGSLSITSVGMLLYVVLILSKVNQSRSTERNDQNNIIKCGDCVRMVRYPLFACFIQSAKTESKGLQQHPQCMPEQYKVTDDPVTAYRNYYNGEKHFAQWTKREILSWYRKI